MKVTIKEDASLKDIEITIQCPREDQKTERLIAMIQMMDFKLIGMKEKQKYILDASRVLYIDTADKRTFLYTDNAVYETPFKLYELEERLADMDFFRAGKSCIINFNQIKSLRPDLDGRILVTVNNGEKLFVSRQYAGTIKEKLEDRK